MQLSLTTILAAASFFMASTSAAPAQEAAANPLDTRADCGFHARQDSIWHENALSRRRIVYRNSGGFAGDELGALWTAEDAIAKCSAINNNIGIYVHAGLQAWVVDHNQVLGPAGDAAADCLLERFRDKIGRHTGCKDES